MTTKRIVTGARYGLKDWLAQRITAIVLAVYLVYLLLAAFGRAGALDYGNWFGLFQSPLMRVATLLAVIALIWHAWIGVRDILMDYIKPTGLRLTLQVLTVVVLVGYAAWSAVILWGA
jgi:succinate dehydrogenase / fumarate reductase membrane anchor subunit